MPNSAPLLMKAQDLKLLLQICLFSRETSENQKKTSFDAEKIQNLFLRYSRHTLILNSARDLLQLLEGSPDQKQLDALTFDIRYFIQLTVCEIETSYNVLGRTFINEPWEAVSQRRQEAKIHTSEYLTAFHALCEDINTGKVTLSDVTQ